MKKALFVIILAGITIFIACSPKTAAVKIPVKTTYNDTVLHLVQAKCAPCHLPSKGGRKASFETYAGALKYSADMVKRIELNPTDRGFMPFKHDKLPEAEIAVFKKWISDGTLEK